MSDKVEAAGLNRALRVYLCHSPADKPRVRELYERLKSENFEPWLDEKEILPGQDWDAEIKRAMRESDVIALCLSQSALKAGKESIYKPLKFALDVSEEQPEGTIFIIPILFEECDIPDRLSRVEPVKLFEPGGPEKLIRALRRRADDLDIPSISSSLPENPVFAKSLVFASILLFCLWIQRTVEDKTDLGKSFESWAYKLFQERLSLSFDEGDLSVAVVDISKLMPSSSSAERQPSTNRQALSELIRYTAAAKPLAIGVDLDFSPDEDGYVRAGDPQFFQQCLNIKNASHVPIFLGVKRQQTGLPSDWLGNEAYRELAATIIVPNDGRRMLRWLHVDSNHDPLFGLSASLAGVTQETVRQPPKGLRWAIAAERKVTQQYFSAGDFWINYSPLSTFERHFITASTGEEIAAYAQQLRGKIVILGDVTNGYNRDTSSVPMRTTGVPGVLVHACGAYTLLKGPPYLLTGFGRVMLDIVASLIVSFVIVGGVAVIRVRSRHRSDLAILFRKVSFLIISFAIITGLGFMLMAKLVWHDFLTIAVFIFGYSQFEQLWMTIEHRITKKRQHVLATYAGGNR